MSLKSLVVSDTTLRCKEISRILEISRIDVTLDEKYALDLNPSLSLLPYDLVIIAIQSRDRAIFISEEISRLLPDTKTIFLFESSADFSYLFGSTMKQMVDWMISYDNIDNLSEIIDEIFNEKYCVVRKTKSDVNFSEREINIIRLIQMDVDSLEIQLRLNISERTFNRCIGDCGTKMDCKGRGSIGVRSFSILGDLRD
jgi:DNA-binding CsgD family transcriptional regulator